MAVRESTLSGEAHRAPTRDLSTSSEREADDRRGIREGGSGRAIRGVAESSGERDDGWRGARGGLARPICTLPGGHQYGRGRGLWHDPRRSDGLREERPRDERRRSSRNDRRRQDRFPTPADGGRIRIAHLIAKRCGLGVHAGRLHRPCPTVRRGPFPSKNGNRARDVGPRPPRCERLKTTAWLGPAWSMRILVWRR